MAHTALDVYLNDHLAGSTMGVDLARQLHERNEGAPLGDLMGRLAAQIEDDRATLEALMERLGTTSNPLKEGASWLAEKASRLKFSGASTGDRDLGNYLALETLSLGVEGKLALWQALDAGAREVPEVAELDLTALIEGARSQRAALERERLALAPAALRDDEG